MPSTFSPITFIYPTGDPVILFDDVLKIYFLCARFNLAHLYFQFLVYQIDSEAPSARGARPELVEGLTRFLISKTISNVY